MATNNVSYLGPGGYSRADNEKRALARLEAQVGGVETIGAKAVIRPEPSQDWAYEPKLLWTLAMADEAVDGWSSGDYAQLYLACEVLHRAFTDERRRTPPANTLDVVFGVLRELRLSDTAKRNAGILVNREPVEVDPNQQWLDDLIAAEVEAETE